MGFLEKDRDMIIKTHTDVAWIKKEYSKRLDNLEKEDKLLHHRINKNRNLFIGLSAGLSTISAGVTAWLKSLTGGN